MQSKIETDGDMTRTLIFWITFLILVPCYAQEAVWLSSKTDAFELARSQGKLVLLLAGRSSCSECDTMRNAVCERTNPPVRQTIDQVYVPWYCDIDTSNEHKPYEQGLAVYALPLICLIDPVSTKLYVDRKTGLVDAGPFLTALINAGRNVSPKSINLSEGQQLTTDVYTVEGPWFSTLGATNTYFRLNDGEWYRAASDEHHWLAELGQLLDGSNALDVYTEFKTGKLSPTNRLSFSYSQTAPAPAIISQPSSIMPAIGTTATFAISAQGDLLTYQWYFNSISEPLVETGSVLTIPNVSCANVGQYFCVITDSLGRKLTSQPASLILFTEPEVYPVITAYAPVGTMLALEYQTTQTGSTNWIRVSTNLITSSPQSLIDPTFPIRTSVGTNALARLYRLVIL